MTLSQDLPVRSCKALYDCQHDRGAPMLKPQTRESYINRLDRMLDYVYAHLDDDLSFDRLAEIACLSPYHWSRIYSAMRGETIVATIRRLRLQRAADRLANSEITTNRVAKRA